MKDEIKEILRIAKECDFIDTNHEETKELLDYITNLQTIEQQYSAVLSENAELENKITNLQEENERLKELIDCDNEEYDIQEMKKRLNY